MRVGRLGRLGRLDRLDRFLAGQLRAKQTLFLFLKIFISIRTIATQGDSPLPARTDTCSFMGIPVQAAQAAQVAHGWCHLGHTYMSQLTPTLSATDRAGEWLCEVLRGGPIASAEVRQRAGAAGHSWRTIERVRGSLGIRATRAGFEGGWSMSLPPKP